ncbi:hypothetical protein DRP53_08075 [candidate division WOR-3 bacterium]|uniref:HEAT repeat domain-containing protein n=1 Tax=candidate division WOR-3 bacterium TaxID=2052148 RepID=A0A660SFR9_UNCW3|nr:MAG: hypothetical protein DRP53_08075 [candidate division WOR-3 bacterium]
MAEIPSRVKSDFIKNLGIGINISRMYPSGHPSLDATLGRIYDLAQEIFNYSDEFSIYVLENIIFFEEEKFDIKKIPAINAMLSSFHKLNVRSVTFRDDMTMAELKAFLTVMGMGREELENYGDIVLLVKDHGIEGIRVNEVEYGIIKGGVQTTKKVDLEEFIKALTQSMSEEASIKFLTEIIGIEKGDNEIVQSRKVVRALERISRLIIERYGEESWGEYSLLLAKALENLSPSVKAQLARIKTENERLAETIRDIITTMSNDDLVNLISRRASEETDLPDDVILILKKLTGPRLSELMPRLKDTLTEEIYKKLVERLAPKEAEEKKKEKGLEGEMRSYYPLLRDKDPEKRRRGIVGITRVIVKLIRNGEIDTARMGINRLSATSDVESDERNFKMILGSLVKIGEEENAKTLCELINKIIIRHASRIGDEFTSRRKAAITILGKLGNIEHLSVLFSALWESGLYNETRDALLQFGERVVEPLLNYLGDVEDRGVRMKIIDILKRVNREDLMPVLRELIKDERWYVRRNIVTLLGEFRDHESVEEIGKCLKDKSRQVRLEAIESLARIGGEKVAGYLMEILDGEVDEIFVKAATYLPKSMARKALPKLIPLLKRKRAIPDKEEEEFRRGVIRAIANIGSEEAIEPLVRVVKDSPLFKGKLLTETKLLALDAIARCGGRERLKEFTSSRNQEIATHAQRLLKETK